MIKTQPSNIPRGVHPWVGEDCLPTPDTKQ